MIIITFYMIGIDKENRSVFFDKSSRLHTKQKESIRNVNSLLLPIMVILKLIVCRTEIE